MIERKMALDNLIYKIRTGSDLYGTVTETSDTDYVGIFIPNKEYVLGLKNCDQVILSEKNTSGKRNQKGDIDYTIYSLPKFINLAINNNPNIMELFFAPDRCILEMNDFARTLINAYPLFVSKKSYHTFKGYSYAQRKKLEIKKENMTGRRELAEKFGYDTKYASHLIRLMLEGHELLVEGKIMLPLAQNNLVRDIKMGCYSLEWVFKKADELERLVDLAYTTSKIQYRADLKEIDKLQIKLLEEYWSR